MANQISPQGYQLNDQPINENPFWGGESPAPGSLIVTEISVTKQVDGNYTTYTWSYMDQLGERHALTTQRVAGNAGDDGVTFTPHVSANGVISWTNDGGLPNPDPVSIVGPQGATGPQGPQGIQGIQGPRGLTGPTGAQGVPGPTGATGPQGPQGVPGTTPLVDATASVTNTTGTPTVAVTKTGEPAEPVFNFAFSGIKGETGPTGPQGPQGVPGDVGAMPEITADATIDSNVGTPAVSVIQSGTAAEPVLTFNFSNLKGETGATGPTGPAGQDGMGTVAVGTTTTGEPGTNASVTNSGTAQDAVLNFTIPRGATGATGPAGATGPQGPTGPSGNDGKDGNCIWTTTVAPTSPNYTFTISNLVGPAGRTPQVGDIIIYSYYRYTISSVDTTTVLTGSRVSLRGSAGTAATIAVGTVTTGAAGSSASVTNSGSSSAAVFDFTIPKGDTGPAGANGQGVPTGGTAGQVLTKNSGTNYDASWQTPSGGGGDTYTSIATNQPLDTGTNVVKAIGGSGIATGRQFLVDVKYTHANLPCHHPFRMDKIDAVNDQFNFNIIEETVMQGTPTLTFIPIYISFDTSGNINVKAGGTKLLKVTGSTPAMSYITSYPMTVDIYEINASSSSGDDGLGGM